MPTFWDCNGPEAPWGAGPLSHSRSPRSGRRRGIVEAVAWGEPAGIGEGELLDQAALAVYCMAIGAYDQASVAVDLASQFTIP
jgi:hypothetical protein